MKKKILIIVENLPVPMDVRVWREALSLRDAGYEVVALCPKHKSAQKGYEFLDGIHIYRHPSAKEGKGSWDMFSNMPALCSGSLCTHGGFIFGEAFM